MLILAVDSFVRDDKLVKICCSLANL